MNLLLMQNGFCPIIIRPRDRKRYINSIEKTQLTGEIEEYMRFMLFRLNSSYTTIFDIFDTKNEIPQEKLMTIAKFAGAVGVPVSTIRYWVKVGKLSPIMYTESGYMMFSKSQIDKTIRISQKK